MKIFISYRRDDTGPTALLLRHVLRDEHGDDAVFLDLTRLEDGRDFTRELDGALAQSDVVLVLIGRQWWPTLQARAEQPGVDWVRREVALSLAAARAGRLRVVPVWVDGAGLPAQGLPDDLAALPALQGPKFESRAPDEGQARVLAAVRGESDARRRERETAERRARWWALGAGLLALAGAVTQPFEALGLDSRVHRATLALAQRLAPAAAPGPGGVAVVGLDAASVAEQPSRTLRRAMIARAVEQAAAGGARALALDFEFDEPGDPAADAALAAALAAVQPRLPVRLAARNAAAGAAPAASPPAVDPATAPPAGDPLPAVAPALLPAFAAHAPWALACVGERGDRVAVAPLLAVRGGDDRAGVPPLLQPSLALATWLAAEGLQAGEFDPARRELALLRAGRRVAAAGVFAVERLREPPADCTLLRAGDLLALRWLDLRAVAPAQIAPRVSLAALARGAPEALAAVRGRVVVVGDLRDAGNDDRHATAAGTLPGALLVAAQIDELQRGGGLRAPSLLEMLLLCVGAALAGSALALALRRADRRVARAVGAVALLGVPAAAVGAYLALQVLAAPHYVMIAAWAGWMLARRKHR